MARVKRGVHARKKRKEVLNAASGYYGNRSRSFRSANEAVMHAGNYAFRDRRARKGEMRKLWIQRINAGARKHDMSYSRLISGLKAAEVDINRKMLAELAVSDDAAFAELVVIARNAAGSQAGSSGVDGGVEATKATV